MLSPEGPSADEEPAQEAVARPVRRNREDAPPGAGRRRGARQRLAAGRQQDDSGA